MTTYSNAGTPPEVRRVDLYDVYADGADNNLNAEEQKAFGAIIRNIGIAVGQDQAKVRETFVDTAYTLKGDLAAVLERFGQGSIPSSRMFSSETMSADVKISSSPLATPSTDIRMEENNPKMNDLTAKDTSQMLSRKANKCEDARGCFETSTPPYHSGTEPKEPFTSSSASGRNLNRAQTFAHLPSVQPLSADENDVAISPLREDQRAQTWSNAKAPAWSKLFKYFW